MCQMQLFKVQCSSQYLRTKERTLKPVLFYSNISLSLSASWHVEKERAELAVLSRGCPYPQNLKQLVSLKITNEQQDSVTDVLHQVAQHPIDQVLYNDIQGAHAPLWPHET